MIGWERYGWFFTMSLSDWATFALIVALPIAGAYSMVLLFLLGSSPYLLARRLWRTLSPPAVAPFQLADGAEPVVFSKEQKTRKPRKRAA
jgi:hypothetical protein